jgi:hypothetical protein
MIIISHRGNLFGRNIERENSEQYIKEAVEMGFDVEVDVWAIDEKLFLGHDLPQYETSIEFLKSLPLWCHAKNVEALKLLLDSDLNCFWHNTDTFTLTSRNQIWCYSDVQCKEGIMVCLGQPNGILEPKYAVCSDYPLEWKTWRDFR